MRHCRNNRNRSVDDVIADVHNMHKVAPSHHGKIVNFRNHLANIVVQYFWFIVPPQTEGSYYTTPASVASD